MDSAKKPRFDGTVNLGHLLQGLMLAGGLIAIYNAGQANLTEINVRLAIVEKSTNQISEAVVLLARQDERLNSFNDRIVKLETRTTRLEDRLEPGGKAGAR